MRTITLEEHFAHPGFFNGPGADMKAQSADASNPIKGVYDRLLDLEHLRISGMDAAGIDMQVLSLTSPGTEQCGAAAAKTLAREANDYAWAAIKNNPGRLAAFAALPTADPEAAAAELERTVKDYGFKGAVINGHVNGRYLDDRFFWPIFERAQVLHVPIYLHPTPPPQAVIDASYSGFSPMVSKMLASAGWGWHLETATHIIRIILGGVFDAYPNLQIIVGHLGETLPFMLQRVDVMRPEVTKLKKPISSYLRENIYYTISGFNFTPVFLNLLMEVGADHIMFSADYPYASMQAARSFLDNLPISTADKEKIAHGNAEKLMGL